MNDRDADLLLLAEEVRRLPEVSVLFADRSALRAGLDLVARITGGAGAAEISAAEEDGVLQVRASIGLAAGVAAPAAGAAVGDLIADRLAGAAPVHVTVRIAAID